MIFPAVVEKSYTAIDSFVDNLLGGLLVLSIAEMVSAYTQRGNPQARLPEFALKNSVAALLHLPHVSIRSSTVQFATQRCA
jgi:hypothetical protein